MKNHSQGEYVFDHGWADAFERAGGQYYPKLQCSIPFTPATGRRLLVKPDEFEDENRQLLANGLKQLCDQIQVSSAHLTFLPKDEWDTLKTHGYLCRLDQQFHWQNDGFQNFDEFLGSLNSRKRKAIRKERRAALAGNGIAIEWITGSDLVEAVWDSFFEFYLDTGSRKWGRPYLNRKFYSLIGERMADDIVMIMAKREGKYVAGAINFIGGDTLYGRHWGCIEDHPFCILKFAIIRRWNGQLLTRNKRLRRVLRANTSWLEGICRKSPTRLTTLPTQAFVMQSKTI